MSLLLFEHSFKGQPKEEQGILERTYMMFTFLQMIQSIWQGQQELQIINYTSWWIICMHNFCESRFWLHLIFQIWPQSFVPSTCFYCSLINNISYRICKSLCDLPPSKVLLCSASMDHYSSYPNWKLGLDFAWPPQCIKQLKKLYIFQRPVTKENFRIQH